MQARLSLRSPFTPHAFVVGLLLTSASFAAVFSWIGTSAMTRESLPESLPTVLATEIRFVTIAVPAGAATPSAPRVERMVPRRGRDSTSTQPVASVAVPPSAPALQPPAAAALTPQGSSLTPPAPSWRNRDFYLPLLKAPLPRLTPPTAAERDSAAKEFARLAAARIPTAEEKDEALREMSQPGTIPGRRAGEQGRAGGAGVSVGLPLFSSGPSRAQRKRDSIAHAENLERLARLMARAQAKRDSAPF